jgi:hypothetical protein
MNGRPPPSTLLRLGVLLVSLAACSRSGAKVEISRPPEPLQLVAVQPAVVRFQGRLGEAERQTLVLLDLLWRDSTWSVLTPEEFMVLDPASADFLHATNLVVVTHALGLDPKRFGVLRTTLTAREAKGQAVVAGGGKVAVGRDYEGFIDASLELSDAAGRPLGTATASAKIDLFAQLPENDEAPWVRQALTSAAHGLFAACTGCVVAAPRASFPLFANPGNVYRRLDGPGRAPLNGLEVDELTRQQRLWRFFQFFDPATSLREAERLLKLGDSICTGELAELPFQPGDCITGMNGTTYRSPHTLLRVLEGATSVMLDVVDREGTRRMVNGKDLLP